MTIGDTPSCPSCTRGLTYIDNQQRYFCFTCQKWDVELFASVGRQDTARFMCPTCQGLLVDVSHPCPYCGQEFSDASSQVPDIPAQGSPPEPSLPDTPPLRDEDVKEYSMDELKKEVADTKVKPIAKRKKRAAVDLLEKERKNLEEDRRRFMEDMKQQREEMKYLLETEISKRETAEAKQGAAVPSVHEISDFAVERRKRKQVDKIGKSLFVTEIIIMVLLMLAFILPGLQFSPLEFQIEPAIWICFLIFLIISVERIALHATSIKHATTLQSKFLETDDYITKNIPNIIIYGIVLVILLLDMTRNQIKIFVTDPLQPAINATPDFYLILTLFCIAYFLTFLIWAILLSVYKKRVLVPERKKKVSGFAIEDVFVITTTGLLITHITRRLKPGVDDDILTGMLTVIKDFVKDSFKTHEEGELDEIQYGRLRVLIEYGPRCYLALVTAGMEPASLRKEMKSSLKLTHRKYGETLRDWDGDLSKIVGIKKIVESLVSKKF